MIHREVGLGRTITELSKEEQERIKEILEELRLIFNAQSVMLSSELTFSNKTNYTIEILNGDVRGYIYEW